MLPGSKSKISSTTNSSTGMSGNCRGLIGIKATITGTLPKPVLTGEGNAYKRYRYRFIP